MTYGNQAGYPAPSFGSLHSGSIKTANKLYNEAKTDRDDGQNDSAREKAEQALQLFQQCQGTDEEAREGVRKTTELLKAIKAE